MKSKIMNNRGFSLPELLAVIAIMAVLLGLAGIAAKGWIDKYNEEGQMRQMQADLLQARVKAMEKNKQHFVQVSAGAYTLKEDTNDNGSQDSADAVLMQQTLKWTVSSISSNPPTTVALPFNIQIDQRGLLSFPDSPNACSVSIRFNTGTMGPEFDCFEFYPTRINLGKWDTSNGGSCVTR